MDIASIRLAKRFVKRPTAKEAVEFVARNGMLPAGLTDTDFQLLAKVPDYLRKPRLFRVFRKPCPVDADVFEESLKNIERVGG